jgi:antitoxin VapB
MDVARHVKIFRDGRNQAVRIPRKFELPGTDAIMRKEGPRLVIEPTPRKSLSEILRTLKPLEDELPPNEELPIEPVDL